MKLDAIVHEIVPCAGPLSTVRVLLDVMTSSPPMCAASIQQSASTVWTGIEEGTLNRGHRDTMVSVVPRVGEVPPATKHQADAVIVRSVVTHWVHLLLFACLANVGPVHHTTLCGMNGHA